MKMKINKACDLSSISVLPPQSRRSSVVSVGAESSSRLGKSQNASQLRSQQVQLSQQSLSHGLSSQHGGQFSQFSQNCQDDALTNGLKIESQERENSMKRSSCLPPINYTREESQMQVSRTSNNLIRKWSVPEYKCHLCEELQHRIGTMETSVNRLGMVVDSIQTDVVQVCRCCKEIASELEGIRQKLTVSDDPQQLMNKCLEDIRNDMDAGFKSVTETLNQSVTEALEQNMDAGFKSVSETLKQIRDQEKSHEIALSEKFDSQIIKLQTDLCTAFSKEMKALACSMTITKQNQATPPSNALKALEYHPPSHEVQIPKNEQVHLKQQQEASKPKVETGRWTSVKRERSTSRVGIPKNKSSQMKMSSNKMKAEQRVDIESDEEIDEVFSALLKDEEADMQACTMDDVNEETNLILQKARRRKRKYRDTVIVN